MSVIVAILTMLQFYGGFTKVRFQNCAKCEKTHILIIFYNFRTKWKRQAAVGVDLLQEASNLAAVQNLIRTNPYWAQYMANPFFAQRLLPTGLGAALPGMPQMPGGTPLGQGRVNSSSSNSISSSPTPNGRASDERAHEGGPESLFGFGNSTANQELMMLAAAANKKQPEGKIFRNKKAFSCNIFFLGPFSLISREKCNISCSIFNLSF